MEQYTLNGIVWAEKFDGKIKIQGMAKVCSNFMCRTPRGVMRVYVGDYIIKTQSNELLVVPSNIFDLMVGDNGNI